jgi:hypothetical protein
MGHRNGGRERGDLEAVRHGLRQNCGGTRPLRLIAEVTREDDGARQADWP